MLFCHKDNFSLPFEWELIKVTFLLPSLEEFLPTCGHHFTDNETS